MMKINDDHSKIEIAYYYKAITNKVVNLLKETKKILSKKFSFVIKICTLINN